MTNKEKEPMSKWMSFARFGFEVGVEWNGPGQLMLGLFLFRNASWDEPWELGLSLVWVSIVARGTNW